MREFILFLHIFAFTFFGIIFSPGPILGADSDFPLTNENIHGSSGPPQIVFLGEIPKETEQEIIRIKIQIIALDGIENFRLTVNNTKILMEDFSHIQWGSNQKQVIFSTDVGLQPGDNQIHIQAQDQSGNKNECE